jgi:hypothetical protein
VGAIITKMDVAMILKKKILLCILSFFILTTSNGFADVEKSDSDEPTEFKWTITLFNGVSTERTIDKAIFNLPGNFESNYIHGLALSRELWKIGKHFSWDLEGMFAKHHGKHKTGYQNYEEYVIAILLRYHTFPWDHYIDTSFAIGEGLSLTSETPQRELQRHNRGSQRLLNYLAFELSFALPKYPKASLVYRLHHRSGVFGLFGGVRGASDFYMLGLRYNF